MATRFSRGTQERDPGRLMLLFDEPPRYRAYLLRFWEERDRASGHRVAWRFSLEDVHTRERRGFASLEALVAFLEAQTGEESPHNR